jgi:c-di-GMP-binding flagellar brake protein YcgR
MSNLAVNQADASAAAATDYHQFAVASRLEINQILRAIMHKAALISASIGGENFFLTSLISMDEEAGYLMLECDRQGKHVAHVLDRQRLLCTTTLDKIKIQFVCQDLAIAPCDGRDAFRAALPHELMRLQRREYYRISTPIASPVKCTILNPQSQTHPAVVLNLIDISCGGIAVLTPPELFTPELGTCYDCTLTLPGVGAPRVQMQARNSYMMKLATGKAAQRAGFAFVNLSQSTLGIIQRYMMNLERQRRR